MKKNNAFPQKLKYSHGKGPALYNDSQFDDMSSANDIQINSLSMQNE